MITSLNEVSRAWLCKFLFFVLLFQCCEKNKYLCLLNMPSPDSYCFDLTGSSQRNSELSHSNHEEAIFLQ